MICLFIYYLFFSDGELPGLVIEGAKSVDNSSNIEGRRVVDMAYFMREYESLFYHYKECTGGKYDFKKESRAGLNSILYFECNACGKTRQVSTQKPDDGNSINTAYVWGALSVGIGHSQAEEMFSILDIPALTGKSFQQHEKKVEQVGTSISELL